MHIVHAVDKYICMLSFSLECCYYYYYYCTTFGRKDCEAVILWLLTAVGADVTAVDYTALSAVAKVW